VENFEISICLNTVKLVVQLEWGSGDRISGDQNYFSGDRKSKKTDKPDLT
jgi:hypothetical protein